VGARQGGADAGGGSLTRQVALATSAQHAGNAATGQGIAAAIGAASASGLESLKYHIGSIAICEDLDVSGSGFQNPRGCLSVFQSDPGAYQYGLQDDWTPLATQARQSDDGFVDLLSASSRATLGGSTTLTYDHVRSYNYGIINWALPIKVKATVPLSDGTTLYTHDGTSTFTVNSSNNSREYFTAPSASLLSGPAEEAVVILPNGGNWFKFQAPLTITEEDIKERRSFVLDLVFNPDGIVKGAANGAAMPTQIRESDAQGSTVRGIAVPMLDLAPIAHRATETVVR
jgi:hypothetical protein